MGWYRRLRLCQMQRDRFCFLLVESERTFPALLTAITLCAERIAASGQGPKAKMSLSIRGHGDDATGSGSFQRQQRASYRMGLRVVNRSLNDGERISIHSLRVKLRGNYSQQHPKDAQDPRRFSRECFHEEELGKWGSQKLILTVERSSRKQQSPRKLLLYLLQFLFSLRVIWMLFKKIKKYGLSLVAVSFDGIDTCQIQISLVISRHQAN